MFILEMGEMLVKGVVASLLERASKVRTKCVCDGMLSGVGFGESSKEVKIFKM